MIAEIVPSRIERSTPPHDGNAFRRAGGRPVLGAVQTVGESVYDDASARSAMSDMISASS